MKLIPVLMLAVILAACGQTIVEDACDKTKDQSIRFGLRETAAREGLYVKCVERGRGWDEYTLTIDGAEAEEVLR